MLKNKKTWKKIYCSNCGKFNHKYKDCREPITSMGIINIKLDEYHYNSLLKLSEIFKKMNKKININDYNNNNLKDIRCIYKFKKMVQFLLIRRKHSLNYIEFLRGRYNTNDIKKITSIMSLMTKKELINISNSNFDKLWDNLWQKTSKIKLYEKEFIASKFKFKNLQRNDIIPTKIVSQYNFPEWGFPKGRRNNFENNFTTAVREFNEETNMKKEDYFILDWVDPIEENYIGTNNIAYKHIYFLAISPELTNVTISTNNLHQKYEIGDIGWFTYDKAIELVRDYYSEKKKIISKIYLFISSIINGINSQDESNILNM